MTETENASKAELEAPETIAEQSTVGGLFVVLLILYPEYF